MAGSASRGKSAENGRRQRNFLANAYKKNLTFKVYVKVTKYNIHHDLFTMTYSPYPIHHDLFTMTYSPWPIHHDLFNMTYSPWPIHHDLFTMTYSPCPIHHDLFTMTYSPWPIHHDLSPNSMANINRYKTQTWAFFASSHRFRDIHISKFVILKI